MFAAALKGQYFMMLGDFGNLNLDEDGNMGELLAFLFFFFSTFIIQITIFNMLIAIMGEAFS